MNRRERARHAIEARVYQDAIGAPPPSKWRSIIPLFTEHGYASRVLRKRLGLPTPLNTEDRRILEQTIFPFYGANPSFQNVLFVGCNTYTSDYQRLYFGDRNFWTIEPNADLTQFGARQHVVAPLEEMGRHFAEKFFDLIICNGVFGWGLDREAQCNAAFEQCHICLREGGHLIFGWDDVARRTPIEVAQISSLARYGRFNFPPLGTWRYLTDTPYRHTFDFYQK